MLGNLKINVKNTYNANATFNSNLSIHCCQYLVLKKIIKKIDLMTQGLENQIIFYFKTKIITPLIFAFTFVIFDFSFEIRRTFLRHLSILFQWKWEVRSDFWWSCHRPTWWLGLNLEKYTGSWVLRTESCSKPAFITPVTDDLSRWRTSCRWCLIRRMWQPTTSKNSSEKESGPSMPITMGV